MNRVILCGRLTRDPEVRYSQTANGSMAVARYTLAVDRTFKKEGEQAADFINCIKKPTYEGDGYDYCPSCGQKLDLDRDEQPTAFSMGAKLIDNFVNPFEIKAGGNS